MKEVGVIGFQHSIVTSSFPTHHYPKEELDAILEQLQKLKPGGGCCM